MTGGDDDEQVQALTEVVERALASDVQAVGEVIEALPAGHPRRRMLLASFKEIVLALGDLPRVLAR